MGRLDSHSFELLTPFKVRDVLFVSSTYDQFVLEEEGLLGGLMAEQYDRFNLTQPPRIIHVSDADAALALVETRQFDLVITMMRIGDMKVHVFGRKVKKIWKGTPVVLLAYNTRELATLRTGRGIDHIFVWSGDSSILFAISKMVEDKKNLDHDIKVGDVQVMLLVEDSRRFYSTYLPRFYSLLLDQTSRLMYDGFNIHDKILRLRSRAKVLLATSYEEAEELIDKYGNNMIGLFTDGRFPYKGRLTANAGLKLVKEVRKKHKHMPILFQSTEESNKLGAEELGCVFLAKDEANLHASIEEFMQSHMSFGDFNFRSPNGETLATATNLAELRLILETIPEDSLRFHAEQNHFSHWLRTRTEFELAAQLRPKTVGEFSDIEGVRIFIISKISNFLTEQREREVFDFSLDSAKFSVFQKLGKGSLGGKGRGLAFFFTRMQGLGLKEKYPDISIGVPRTMVVATDIFEGFMKGNNLYDLALSDASDEEIAEAFLNAKFDSGQKQMVEQVLEFTKWPLAIRSSSLLEDALHQPFAGVYATYMLPNDHPDLEIRVKQLVRAIKLVYASTFFKKAKAYVAATPNSIEEERMAVVIQELVGTHHGDKFYPTIAGVARSHNHYPVGEIEPEDGLVALALGLGKTVADGERCLRISPAHPKRIHQFASTEMTLKTAQREFWAVRMEKMADLIGTDPNLTMIKSTLDVAESDGQLKHIGSTFIAADDRIVDTLARDGPRLITMHGPLKRNSIPLLPILQDILTLLEDALSCPVEIEFAMLNDPDENINKFSLIQLRPLVADLSDVVVDLDEIDEETVILKSSQSLGNGIISKVKDIIYVDPRRLNRMKTRDLVPLITRLNNRLKREKRPYLLIGPGRWGSSDPSLGIPVSWSNISAAVAIVECDMVDIKVEPSQGTHFFQNIVSFQIGYLTVKDSEGGVDFDWLDQYETEFEQGPLRHIRLETPIRVLLDSRNQTGLVQRPI